MKKIQEKINIFMARSPQKAVLVGIMLLNSLFFLVAAVILAILSNNVSGMKGLSFWEAVYRTITMVLDAGCIEGVISDVGKAGAFAAVICLIVILFGMIFFTGAVIGYVTNGISDFIDSKNNGKHKLIITDHIVIINWNPRAAELINELLYRRKKEKVVVLVQENREKVLEEIKNRLNTTIVMESQKAYKEAEGMPFLRKKKYLKENLLRDKITYIVREGDVAAATDLDDICISEARSVIILDNTSTEMRNEQDRVKGNTQTVKTLIQVSEISKANSRQRILVEVGDAWTEDLVYRVVDFNEDEGKEKIIPISYNRLLGITYSQIAMMPEINEVYDNLLSNKGEHFLSRDVSADYSRENENAFMKRHLERNCRSVPLTVTESESGSKAFFMAFSQSDIEEDQEIFCAESGAKLNNNCVSDEREVVVLGHNSNMETLMEGFDWFRKRGNKEGGGESLHIVMVDDEESLKSHNYYKEYPFVDILSADIYDENTINRRVLELTRKASDESTVLVLSDDAAENEDADANVLTYLIYIQEELKRRKQEEPDFRRDRLDVVVEILNPKNIDVVKSYGADRVIVSNSYLSRVISQLSLGEAIYEFWGDILLHGIYDEESTGKDISIRKAGCFFEELPGKCTADELIRMVFESGAEDSKPIIMGYVRNEKDFVFFSGDQRSITVELEPEDKLIIFGNH